MASSNTVDSSPEEILQALKSYLTQSADYFKFKGVNDEFEKLGRQLKRGKLTNPSNPLKGINEKVRNAIGQPLNDKHWYGVMNNRIIDFLKRKQTVPATSSPDETHETGSDFYGTLTVLKATQDKLPSFSQQITEAEKKIHVEPADVKQAQETIQKKYKYFEEGKTAVTPAVLDSGLGVNNEDKLSFKEVMNKTVETDDREIDDMVSASKIKNWDNVWPTLDKKPYLVNCIPEKRAWAVLHQAIYHNSLYAVKKLIEDYGADVTVRTKADLAGAADPGTDALSLAVKFDRKEIYIYLLLNFIVNTKARRGQDISYFVKHRHGIIFPFQKYPLFQITLASYKSMFMKSQSYKLDPSKHILHIVKDVITNSDNTWEDARTKIRSTLYGIDRGHSEYLLSTTNKDEFFERVILLVTEESVYHHLTPALIRQSNSPYKPLAADLAVGPFALMLSAILLHWDRLELFNGMTYRGVDTDVTDKYKCGETLLFLYFIASSKSKEIAEVFKRDGGTLFIFDNSTSTKWQPRSIEHYSRLPEEKECLYPLGAEFRVKSVDKKSREIHLQLLNPSK